MTLLVVTPKLDQDGGIQTYSKNLLGSLDSLNVNYAHLEVDGGLKAKVAMLSTLLPFLRGRREFCVISTHVSFSVFPALIKLIRPFKLVTVAHGVEVWRKRNLLKRIGYSLSDVVCPVSRYTRRVLERCYDLRGKTHLLPGTVDVDRDIKTYQPPNKILKFLTLSRIDRGEDYKGHRRLLDCLEPGASEDVRCFFAGGGDNVESIKENVSTKGLQGVVEVLGRVSDEKKEELLRECEAFLLPSRGEGLGLVYLEALGAGQVCVAEALDGSGDIFPDSNTRLTIRARSKRALKETIFEAQAFEPSEFSDEYEKQSAIEEEFAPDAFAERLRDMLRKIGIRPCAA